MVSDSLREFVRTRAQELCEYCHSPEFISADRFTIEHLMPQSLGGSSDPSNLALACRRCNERRYNFLTGIDPDTQEETTLFNPRQQQWSEHFIWTSEATQIIGTTPTGRATCDRLDMNDEFHNNRFIQKSRRFWTKLGYHPPKDDPRQKG